MSRERGEREKQRCIKCTSMYLRIFVKKSSLKLIKYLFLLVQNLVVIHKLCTNKNELHI
jgi:hypothetical protein